MSEDGSIEFSKFLKKQKCSIPKDFIIMFYKLTLDDFILLDDLVVWLNITRDGIMKTLKKSYIENKDYFSITKDEGNELSKLKSDANLRNNISHKAVKREYYKITDKCFKQISMSSNSKNGKLVKEYYIEMERIVKEFYKMIYKENKTLKNNQKKPNIPNEEGVYVWHYGDELRYRIQCRN